MCVITKRVWKLFGFDCCEFAIAQFGNSFPRRGLCLPWGNLLPYVIARVEAKCKKYHSLPCVPGIPVYAARFVCAIHPCSAIVLPPTQGTGLRFFLLFRVSESLFCILRTPKLVCGFFPPSTNRLLVCSVGFVFFPQISLMSGVFHTIISKEILPWPRTEHSVDFKTVLRGFRSRRNTSFCSLIFRRFFPPLFHAVEVFFRSISIPNPNEISMF